MRLRGCQCLQRLITCLLVILLSVCLHACGSVATEVQMEQDPYLWLEAPVDSEPVSAWLSQQIQTTLLWQQQQPRYEHTRADLQKAWDHRKWMVADIRGGQVFFYYNPGLSDHFSLYMQPYEDFVGDRVRRLPPGSSARELIGGNEFADDAGPGAISISPDASWLAYQVDRRTPSGHRQSLWYLRSLTTAAAVPRLLGVSHGDWTLPAERLAWGRQADKVFFTVSVPPDAGSRQDDTRWHSRVYVQRLGSALSLPEQIHATADGQQIQQMHVPGSYPELDTNPVPGGDGQSDQLLLLAAGTGAENDNPRWCLVKTESTAAPGVRPTACKELAAAPGVRPTACKELAAGPALKQFVGMINGMPAFISSGTRGTGAIILVDADQRRELIAETDAPLHSARRVGQSLVLEYLVHGSSTLQVADLQGQLVNKGPALSLPAPVRLEALRAIDDDRLLISYSGILVPPRSVLVDVQGGQQTVLTEDRPELPLDRLQARLVLVDTGDVQVPLWIAGAGGDAESGAGPVQMLLEVYGGFAAPMETSFSISRLAWLVSGGSYAVAGPRGGGDYGEHWHRAGSGEHRDNSIADVLSVADWLKRERLSGGGSLAISGRSHGGLLAAEAVQRAPRTFAALIAEAGVFDLARVDAMGGAEFWQREYRGAESSPYQALLAAEGNLADHPPTLLITRDNDEVVAPAHSFKYLQSLQARPSHRRFTALLAIAPGRGHQAGGRVDDLIDDYALRWTFLNSRMVMGMLPR